MLSAASTDVVRATLPVVAGAIDDITATFYRRMFAAHPELERDLFNRGNQARGEQQRALAGAIAAFAALQLGDAVTPDVAAAWDELYWSMAEALVAMESGLYASAGVAPGQVWRAVRVAERRYESPDTVSFLLSSQDGEPLPSFAPGQYISVAVGLPDGVRQIRQYSLSSAPGREWRITVKRVAARTLPDGTLVPAGEVSNFLHANVFEDDVLTVSAPFGDLVLPAGDSPLLLASAGIGCTPMIGMLSHLAETADPRPVSVLHADRSAGDHAHRAEHIHYEVFTPDTWIAAG